MNTFFCCYHGDKEWLSAPCLRLAQLKPAALLLLAASTVQSASAADSFTAFESGQVRPLAMSANGSSLYAVNTPDNRLEVFTIGNGTLTHRLSVPVGLEPVAVAARANGEVWVVNKLSDTVSVIKSDTEGTRVVQTLPVGDEPQDIVFGGADGKFAFISAARRDFSRATSPLIGNADIWVYDADQAAVGAIRPAKVINLFTDVPRSLAVSADGTLVYAASMMSGNSTSVVQQQLVGQDIPPPLENIDGAPAPSTALIVRYENGQWLDAIDRDWSADVPYSITDYDLFTIDASGVTPKLAKRTSGVGTVLFDVAVNPMSGNLYVANLESRNTVRFEGHGVYGGSTVRGDIARNRITVIDGARARPRHLNKHIDFSTDLGTPQENDASLAFPVDMAVTANGRTLYVAAFGSAKIGIFDTAELAQDTFVPNPANHIELSAGGPSGIVLDEARGQAYVLTRFNNAVALIDLGQRQQTGEFPLFNPEPASIVDGRPFLYDARYTSSRGNAACASCHIFGDKDELAWNLGDPDNGVLENPNPFVIQPQPGSDISFHPMKGPMTTQSLRGLANHGPMHWRGDRTGGNDPDSLDPLDENAAFKAFNVAFPGLLGRATELTPTEMQAFTDFILQLTYPPNPLRPKDNSLTAEQQRGQDFYFNFPTFDGQAACNDCHVVNIQDGFFGSDGHSINVRSPQVMKVPHVRNAYTKAGRTRDATGAPGPVQFKGFAYGHAGSTPTVEDLLAQQDRGRFVFPGGEPQRRDVAHWVLGVDSNLAPAVGMQSTVGATPSQTSSRNLAVMFRSAMVSTPRPECDLIAKGQIDGQARGWLLNTPADTFLSDSAATPSATLNKLQQLAAQPGQEITFTCVPPGSGVRMGIDRDEDGVLDADDLLLGLSRQPVDTPSTGG